MYTRHNHSATMRLVLQLYGVTRTRSVPRPLLALGRRCYLARRAPLVAVIIRIADKDSSCIVRLESHNSTLLVVTTVPGHKQQYATALSVYHGRWIATCVLSIVPYDYDISPRSSSILRATHHQIDVSCIANSVTPRLCKRQQCVVRGAYNSGDAECRVTLHSSAIDSRAYIHFV